jgi:hypothetical protein
MAELSVNAAELSVNSAELSANAAEFWFFGRLFRPNFSEFHRIFQKSTGSTISYFFCSARIFKHYKCSGFIKEMNEPGL